MLLTKEEDNVLNILGNAFTEFCKLEELHPCDKQEFCNAIHVAQNIVYARPAFKEFKENNKDKLNY